MNGKGKRTTPGVVNASRAGETAAGWRAVSAVVNGSGGDTQKVVGRGGSAGIKASNPLASVGRTPCSREAWA